MKRAGFHTEAPMWFRRILFLLLIVITAVFASYYSGPLPYALFYLSLLLPLLSYLYLLYIYNRFRVYQLIEKKTLVKYESVPFRFILANEDILTYAHIRVTFLDDYSVLEQVDASRNYTLLSGEREEYATTLMCRYCGKYRVGIDRIVLEDYFRIFRLSYRCPTPMEVHVLPRVLQPERLSLFSLASEGMRLTNNENSPFPDAETRNYQVGDSPRRIHWKALARQGELLTRKQLPEPKPELHIFLDLDLPVLEEAEYLPRFDRLAESTLAVANFYLRTKTPCNIYAGTGGLQRFQLHSQKDFDLLYAFFCGNERISGFSATKLLTAFSYNNITNTKCIIITTAPMPELAAACTTLLDNGNNIAVLCLCKAELHMFSPFISERFTVLPVDPDRDLLSVLESF